VFVVRGGGFLRTDERFLVRVLACDEGVEVRRERRERLCANVRDRRSVARREAVTSADGGSPKMKNFMKAPRRRTMESWPRRRPWVKESLGVKCQPCVIGVRRGTNEDSGLGIGGTFAVAISDILLSFPGGLGKEWRTC
jgi:hypothetical protein